MLIRASLSYGVHFAAGLVLGAMTAALATQFAAGMNRQRLQANAPDESNMKEQLS